MALFTVFLSPSEVFADADSQIFAAIYHIQGVATGACISVKNTVNKPEKPKFEVFEPNRLEDLELWLFGLFNRISDLYTNPCGVAVDLTFLKTN